MSAERAFFDLGRTRFRIKVKRWMYTSNPIKTNTDFDFYVRQGVGSGKSLELYLHHAPEQYIRQLGDRSPYGGRGEAQGVPLHPQHGQPHLAPSGQQEAELLGDLRDQPALLQQAVHRERRGVPGSARHTVGYRVFKRRLKLTVRLQLRGGRRPRHRHRRRDHRDQRRRQLPGYHRDLYRFGLLTWKTPWLPVIDEHRPASPTCSWTTTTPPTKHLFDQPYQVGRRDKNTKVTVQQGRKDQQGRRPRCTAPSVLGPPGGVAMVRRHHPGQGLLPAPLLGRHDLQVLEEWPCRRTPASEFRPAPCWR